MPLVDTTWYCNYGNGSSTGYYAVTAWATGATIAAGAVRRQLAAPAVGSERVFVAIVAGTTHATTEPTWTVTRGAKTTDNTVTWQEATGQPGLCGDTTNCTVWLTVKNTAVVLGQVIYDSGTASLQICSTAGTAGNGGTPGFSATAGTTTADNTVTWTSLGLASGFAAWANPHARAQAVAASTWAAAGNTIFVSNNHAETQSAAMAIPVGASTMAAPFKIYCVNDSTAPSSTLATTATITTTGTSNLQINPFHYTYGITFTCGTGSSATTLFHGINNCYGLYENCTFALASTSATSAISQNSGNSTASYNEYINCTYKFAAVGQAIQLAWTSIFRNGCAFAPSGSVPTTLFNFTGSASRGGEAIIRDCDLSAITGTLVNVGSGQAMTVQFHNCKLGAAVALTTGTSGTMGGARVQLHNCDSANTNYRTALADYPGTVQQETTIVRTGSLATDGTTPISWNVVTTANSTFHTPLVSEDISIWNDSTSSVTVTLYLISNTTLKNNDFWADVEYLGTASFPQGVVSTSRMTPLATAATLTSDSSTWGGSTNKYKIVFTFTPASKGPIKVRFYAAKVSATTYVDPYIYLS